MDRHAALIQTLIQIAISAVNDELQAEVSRLAGSRYRRGNGSVRRRGNNLGAVCLGSQKVSVKVPRVRDVVEQREIALQSYAALRDTRIIEESELGMVLNGLSQRKYEKVTQIVPRAFGIMRSRVLRRFIRASARKSDASSKAGGLKTVNRSKWLKTSHLNVILEDAHSTS